MNIKDKTFKTIAVSIIWLWMALLALAPNLLVFLTSLLMQGDPQLIRLEFTTANYATLFTGLYIRIFIHSFYIAGICTALCLLFGYPFAYCLSRMHERYKGFLLLLVIIPFWTSSLIRSYAMIALLKAKGLLNTFLIWLGVIHTPLPILYSSTAVLIGLVYNLLPFMVLPLYASLEKLDPILIDAARDLGATRTRVLFSVLIPLTLPGIIGGSILVFLPAMSMFFIPDLLGGAKSILLGNLIQNQFLAARNWPMGSAVSVALTVFMGVLLLIYWRASLNTKEGPWK